jgi:hypothetical protein
MGETNLACEDLVSSARMARAFAHGVWIRVGDRRFLETVFVFAFDASRALTTITKVRVNILVSPDGPDREGDGDDSRRHDLGCPPQPRDPGGLLRLPEGAVTLHLARDPRANADQSPWAWGS